MLPNRLLVSSCILSCCYQAAFAKGTWDDACWLCVPSLTFSPSAVLTFTIDKSCFFTSLTLDTRITNWRRTWQPSYTVTVSRNTHSLAALLLHERSVAQFIISLSCVTGTKGHNYLVPNCMAQWKLNIWPGGGAVSMTWVPSCMIQVAELVEDETPFFLLGKNTTQWCSNNRGKLTSKYPGYKADNNFTGLTRHNVTLVTVSSMDEWKHK